jgi:hypothetical protein
VVVTQGGHHVFQPAVRIGHGLPRLNETLQLWKKIVFRYQGEDGLSMLRQKGASPD